MLIKGLYKGTRSRNIAVKPRIDSNADQLLHSSTLCILAFYLRLRSFPLTTSRRNHSLRHAMKICILVRYTLLTFINLKKREKNQFMCIFKYISEGKRREFINLTVIFQYHCAMHRKGPPGRHINN